MSVCKSGEKLLIFASWISPSKIIFVWKVISSMRRSVSSPDETPRSSSKLLRCASYFQLSSQCLIWWWNTASHAWYITICLLVLRVIILKSAANSLVSLDPLGWKGIIFSNHFWGGNGRWIIIQLSSGFIGKQERSPTIKSYWKLNVKYAAVPVVYLDLQIRAGGPVIQTLR